MSRSLFVLPDDTAEPLLEAIDGARKSLRINMFLFSDPALIEAVIGAHRRGVSVRVMLNPTRRNGEAVNVESRNALTKAGVTVKDSNPEFEVTHEKSMIVDDEAAYIMSLNWQTENLTETRDYGIVTLHKHEVAEAIAGFDADWDRRPFAPDASSHLIWCNSNGRERFAHFIDHAKHTLWLENERYQDAVIIERVVRALERGVKVRAVARAPHTLKKDKLIEGVGALRILQDVGAKVHKLHHLRLHGKIMLADSARAIVGSVNITPGSFDGRRELAIEVDDGPAIERLESVVHHDWERSTPLDLSDEGLLEDLEKRGKEAAAADLVLDSGHRHKHPRTGR